MKIEAYKTAEEALRSMTGTLISVIKKSKSKPFHIALSGGSTAQQLFKLWVKEYRNDIPWEAPLAHGNPSVIHQAVSHLKEQGYDMHGKICMVIGNGEMGTSRLLEHASFRLYNTRHWGRRTRGLHIQRFDGFTD